MVTMTERMEKLMEDPKKKEVIIRARERLRIKLEENGSLTSLEDCTKEMFELLSKAGLRCAYDLRHAADNIEDKELSKMFNDRAKMWLNIFNPNNGPKEYSNSLHKEIWGLERDIGRLKNLLIEKGVSEEEIEATIFFRD